MEIEKMYCSVCKKEVDAEVYDLDGRVSYCPICRTGYRETSYQALLREQEDEEAVLSEFENETSPKIVRQLTMCGADGDYCARSDPGGTYIVGEQRYCWDCHRPRRSH